MEKINPGDVVLIRDRFYYVISISEDNVYLRGEDGEFIAYKLDRFKVHFELQYIRCCGKLGKLLYNRSKDEI